MTASDLYLVFSNPKPGREADAIAWYDHVHLAELLELDEVRSAQRFERHGDAGDHQFLAIYDCAASGHATAAAIAAAMASGTTTTTDALDAPGMVRLVYTPATGRMTSAPPN